MSDTVTLGDGSVAKVGDKVIGYPIKHTTSTIIGIHVARKLWLLDASGFYRTGDARIYQPYTEPDSWEKLEAELVEAANKMACATCMQFLGKRCSSIPHCSTWAEVVISRAKALGGVSND